MTNQITAIGWCSKGWQPHQDVFKQSLNSYLKKDIKFYAQQSLGNFGVSYNAVVKEMIAEGHTTFAIANDDIVLRPDTWQTLQQDWNLLKASEYPERKAVGVLACRHDYVRMGQQNVRFKYGRSYIDTIQYPEELQITPAKSVAPILAVYDVNTWVDFPEINWYSDDIQCHDIRAKGNTVWVSRAYCHHIGSMTMGQDYSDEETKAVEWLKINRPDFYGKLAQHRNTQ